MIEKPAFVSVAASGPECMACAFCGICGGLGGVALLEAANALNIFIDV